MSGLQFARPGRSTFTRTCTVAFCRLASGRDQIDDAVVRVVGVGVGHDPAGLVSRADLGEIVLADVEVDPQITQSRRSTSRTPWRRVVADEPGGDELADFDIAGQHRGVERRALMIGVVLGRPVRQHQCRLRSCSDHAPLGVDLLVPRADAWRDRACCRSASTCACAGCRPAPLASSICWRETALVASSSARRLRLVFATASSASDLRERRLRATAISCGRDARRRARRVWPWRCRAGPAAPSTRALVLVVLEAAPGSCPRLDGVAHFDADPRHLARRPCWRVRSCAPPSTYPVALSVIVPPARRPRSGRGRRAPPAARRGGGRTRSRRRAGFDGGDHARPPGPARPVEHAGTSRCGVVPSRVARSRV